MKHWHQHLRFWSPEFLVQWRGQINSLLENYALASTVNNDGKRLLIISCENRGFYQELRWSKAPWLTLIYSMILSLPLTATPLIPTLMTRDWRSQWAMFGVVASSFFDPSRDTCRCPYSPGECYGITRLRDEFA